MTFQRSPKLRPQRCSRFCPGEKRWLASRVPCLVELVNGVNEAMCVRSSQEEKQARLFSFISRRKALARFFGFLAWLSLYGPNEENGVRASQEKYA
mmetsp:Transcript_28612/g.42156  ORF Transcript_28612/g.42156 Transcript_28612/m.42156 type:complete len:96 (+) Transcript_28612:122-409(+)